MNNNYRNNFHNSDCHINIVYLGGSCVNHYREYNQSLKLFECDYSKHYLIVSSSGWIDYKDTIKYRESKYYCMISNGCFINIPKPVDVDVEFGDECVIIKITNENEPLDFMDLSSSSDEL